MRYALLAMTVAYVWAQPKMDIHHISGRASDRLKEAERRWRTTRQRSWHDAATPEERSVIAGATRLYGQLFQPELRSAPRIATFTEKGQDVLVGRWNDPSNQYLYSELIVWDTPQDTCFIFRLPHGSWSGDSAIRSNFERLLLPSRPDRKTPPANGVTVNIARDPYTRQWVGAGGLLINYFPRQFDTGYMNWFDLWETNVLSGRELQPVLSPRVSSGYAVNPRTVSASFIPRWAMEQGAAFE